ncbi:MAG: ATP-binding protein [Chloroflexota bacterium]|nr:MAG: ATP-binding protein [Chloroflexota bacterium]
MDNAIEVYNLTKYYGDLLAVDHINFEVRQGEVFGFLGPNGAGKTTTQRMLTTLLEPTEGRIVIHGRDLARDPYPVKRQMGLLPEEATVYTELTAWENLMFTATLYRVPRSERAARARELLETFGLWEKRDVKVENFSRGMRRRLSIAMAIIHKPALLFLDEPTPGLDAQSARAIRDLIRRMNAEGTTIFLTTHQIEEANQLCDRVAIINYGRIAAIDTPERLKQAFRRVQSVEVALEPDGQTHGQALTALSGVTTAVKMGDKWRLYTEDPSALLPQVMDYARSHDLRVVSLSTLGPSLEDVFLEITGQQVGTVRHETQARGRMQGARGRRGGRR